MDCGWVTAPSGQGAEVKLTPEGEFCGCLAPRNRIEGSANHHIGLRSGTKGLSARPAFPAPWDAIKNVTVCTLFLFLLFFITGCSIVNGSRSLFGVPPSDDDAERMLEQQIKNQSKGSIKMVSLCKIGALKGTSDDFTHYALKYETVIEFQQECQWTGPSYMHSVSLGLEENLRGENHSRPVSYHTVLTSKQRESKGNPVAEAIFASSMGKAYSKGDRVTIVDVMLFEKSRKKPWSHWLRTDGSILAGSGLGVR